MSDKQNNADFGSNDALDIPLSAQLSQMLVAFTLEADNAFARRMIDAGYPTAGLSLVVWLNLMRLLDEETTTVKDIAAEALISPEHLRHKLGCLERWGFVTLEPASTGVRLADRVRRNGWGSGRGIRAEWRVRPTAKGRAALETWPPVMGEIEERWEKRFGARTINSLRDSLRVIVRQFEVALPQGFPGDWTAFEEATFPQRNAADETVSSLPVLLSQALLAFALAFDRRSDAPLALSANTLRVLKREPIEEADIPRLTGASPETSGLGWQLKPYVLVTSAPEGRGKLVRLTARGQKAQQTYCRLVAGIEKAWEKKFGKDTLDSLRDSWRELFSQAKDGRPKICEGLVPPPGVARAGAAMPALGRRAVNGAARRRVREMAKQTEAFLRDPAGTLPHYPLWDMNRGFGP